MPKKTAPKDELPPQPEISIGLVGHVDHGKTTLTERLSGKWTDTHSEEIKFGITIRLGYADAILRKIEGGKGSSAYTVKEKDPDTGKPTIALKKVSFVDAPGHESLMATMLSGANIMDYAILLVSAEEECPQPQTEEHLTALKIIGVPKIIVVQNKIDLVGKEQALKNYGEIKAFLKDTLYADAPIIPLSAQHGANVDVLIETIVETFVTPNRDPKKDPLMFVARSFDINKPGTNIPDMKGGVLGGSLKQGVLKVGQEIEIRPGLRFEIKNQRVYKPIVTKVISLFTGGVSVKEVHPGGSIAVMTTLDPALLKSDSLGGSIVGIPGKMPPVWDSLKLSVTLLERVVGSKEDQAVDPIRKGETLMLNVNSAATVGVVMNLDKHGTLCDHKKPVCAEEGGRVTISRRIGNRFRLIGYGTIVKK